ncbi:MAG: ABC transporter permease [Bacilli bacterium]|nr:ABC transporter permease [Bacilli bacterium]
MNILNKLTIKHLKMNKKRTIVTIIGVILSTALMVGIGLLFSTFREYMIDETISYSGDYHTEFSRVDQDKFSLITNNIKVKDYFYSQHLGFAYLENGTNEYKPYLDILAVSENYFDELNLIDGRMPKNDSEVVISNHIETNGGVKYNIGDTLELNIGERYFDGESIAEVSPNNDSFMPDEYLELEETKKYKVVGVVGRSHYESYSSPGYRIFTKLTTNNTNKKLDVYVHFKNVKDTYKVSEDIAKQLGYENVGIDNVFYREVNYNSSLLALYGVSQYDNMLEGISGILMIILGLVSVGCIIVIYNSFAISVMERKKQFGLFSSIGATKKQLRKTVLFEAFIIGLIGIPLGLLSGFLGIATVIKIMNYLIGSEFTFKLVAYPVFIIIPILFMIATILVSAFIPARRASKITPIEAIRLNDDIKIKSKKLKTNKLVKKLFGIEGELALKNIKRNKKKYRITIISLFISIVMFITFSSFIDYIFGSVDDIAGMPDYDIAIYLPKENKLPIKNGVDTINSILNHEQVDKGIVMGTSVGIISTSDFSKISTDEYKEKFINGNVVANGYTDLNLIVVSNDDFKKYLSEIGESKLKPILLNIQKGIDYTNNSRKNYEMKRYNTTSMSIDLCTLEYSEEDDNLNNKCYGNIDDYYLANTELFGTFEFLGEANPTLIISEDMTEYYQDIYFNVYIKIAAKKYDKLDKMINDLPQTKSNDIDYYNYTEEMKFVKNATLVVKILVYGFICLVTLIGVTSVFNTINTSIALRRKEFAMLRSVGLTPHGFNKILYFESIIFGLKSLLYSLPVSIVLVMLVHASMSNIVDFYHLMLPIKSMIIAIVGVFVIVLITMMYASSKIKRENILEAIREENI